MWKKSFILAMVMIFLAACSVNGGEPIERFSYTDQNGETFGSDQLDGKVWVANFIFTSCTTVCPPMTYNMTLLQDQLEEEGVEGVEFVSFSVDPEIDTPEVLTEFISDYNANFENWHFLTGYSQETIENFARDEFAALVKKPARGEVIHGTSLYVMDSKGGIIKDFPLVDGNGENVPFDEIVKTIKKAN